MPRGRPAATVIESESEEDVDETYTQTQTQTLTQAQRVAAQLPPEVIERKVGELVQYFLIQEQKKIPVKRSDITKHILEKEYRVVFSEVLERAKVKLNQVYGLELKELQQTSGNSKTVKYILLNNLSSDSQADFVDTSSEDPKVGFLFIILGLIFMNNGVVTEDFQVFLMTNQAGQEPVEVLLVQHAMLLLLQPVMWHFLKKLGIQQEEKSHDVFGDVKKLLTQEFTRQLYLEYTRLPNSDPPAYEFRWGQRANASVSKMKVLKFISEKVYKIEPSAWVSQWQEACRSEGIKPDEPMGDEAEEVSD